MVRGEVRGRYGGGTDDGLLWMWNVMEMGFGLLLSEIGCGFGFGFEIEIAI